MSPAPQTLRAGLDYEPVSLSFGTSGRRGRVKDLTQLEIYINVLAELEYLQSLSPFAGGVSKGDAFFFANDLRPSSTRFDAAASGRGEMTQAVARALVDADMKPVYLGQLPTPALASFALERGRGSIMVTGSHLPFDRNGYKTNTAQGELLKKDEPLIQPHVEQVRARIGGQPFTKSPFNEQGMFKSGHSELPPAVKVAAEIFLRRYTDFFAGASLKGKRYLVYQHSAVGRDLLVELLRRLGAEVIPAGRSETFVPIDTEAIDAEQLGAIESLAIANWQEHGPIDAVVSTDGDSDRPLLLGVEPEGEIHSKIPCRVRFFGGDLVGMVVAEYLKADAVVVPISCNDAVDCGSLKDYVEPKTRIGSPYVIAGMQRARSQGRKVVCGWEANGGFLLGSTWARAGRVLTELPTRDAFLPILAVLLRAQEESVSVSTLFDRLPRRFSRAALLKNFPRATSRSLIERFSLADAQVRKASFQGDQVILWGEKGSQLPLATRRSRL